MLQARRLGDVLAAEGTVEPAFARRVVQLLVSSGEDLTTKLLESKVVLGAMSEKTWRVDFGAMDVYFTDHCVVAFGHMPQMY